MIDTIHLQYDFKSQEEIEMCVESLKERYSVDFHYRETSDNSKYPVYQCRCWVDNFKIWLISGQLHIEGSLTKLYYGNNVQQLLKCDIVKAYEMLISKFDVVDWYQAIHRRIDIAVNIELSTSPSILTNKLIGAKRMKRSVIKSDSESVIIGNKSQSIIFYNKTSEYINKTSKGREKINIPDNLLRIECRITGSYPMKKYFNSDKVTVHSILENLEVIPTTWYNMYLSIEKDYSSSIDLFNNKKEMEMKAIAYYGIEPMKFLINESYKAGKLPSATKQNLLRYLREVVDYQRSSSDSVNVIRQLDQKVKEFIKEYS